MITIGSLVRVAALCFGGFAGSSSADETSEVDLLLVLAADASGSMSSIELRLQRDGYARAFRHHDTAAAILSGALGRIAVTYVEWAGRNDQVVVVPWTVLADQQGIADFAADLATTLVSNRGNATAVSSGLLFAAQQFRATGLHSNRRTIDVSGDGISDDGPPISRAHDLVVGEGIVINGLSVGLSGSEPNEPFAYMFRSSDADVHSYYRDQVIGGPGAFAIAVSGLNDFAAAIRRKLVMEIASR